MGSSLPKPQPIFGKIRTIEVEQMLYKELKDLISQENEEYKRHNDAINDAKTEKELHDLQVEKYLFKKAYAQHLYDFIWAHLTELTPKDCTAFDLVPYGVWASLSDKYAVIIDHIKALHAKGEN